MKAAKRTSCLTKINLNQSPRTSNENTNRNPMTNKFEPSQGSILLTNKNSFSVTINPKYTSSKAYFLIHSKTYWHQFKVLNVGIVDMEAVLKRILDILFPLDITPVLMRNDGTNTTFLAQGCGHAIEKLCKSHLIIENLGAKLNLEIIIGFAKCTEIPCDVSSTLIKVIKKRFDKATNHLDLSNFHRDPDLINTVFQPLSVPRFLRHLLLLILNTEVGLLVKSLSLANNEITTFKNIVNAFNFKSLSKLDLRKNLIKNVDELISLKSISLKEILLDENPLCADYPTEFLYIKNVQKVLPNLTKLDDAYVPSPGLPRNIKCFFNSEEDCNLADQFVRHYFTLYDGDTRRKLEGLYHNDARFSLSATYLSGQSTSFTSRLTEYTAESRNLLKLSDFTKTRQLLYLGPKKILGNLCKLPKTEHDPYSFTIDLVHCSSGVVITVSGVFRECDEQFVIRSFHRVFVLVKTGPNTFQIANETLHVKNASTKQVEIAFKVRVPIASKIIGLASANPNEFEKDEMVRMLSRLTDMNSKWSRKCLDETKWDFKEALIVFTELYKISKIPQDAFEKE